MKKIVIFIPGFNIGGVERVMVALANHLFADGYCVTLLVAKDEGELRTFVTKNIEIVCLGNVRLRNILRPLILYLNSTNPDFILCGPDFVNLITIVANVFVKNKTKVIVTQHCYFNVGIKRLGIHARLIPLGIKILYPYAYRIVAVAEGIKSMLLERGIPSDKVIRIYNPIDVATTIQLALSDPGISLPDNYIVYIGRLSYVKNLPLLLRAFALFRKKIAVSLIIVGDGTEKEQLIRMSEKLGIGKEVVFCGSLANPFPVLAKARLSVLPSFSESFGNVIVESMALGITTVGTPTQGIREISDEGKYVYLSDDFSDEVNFARLLEYAYRHPIEPAVLYERSLIFDVGKSIGLYSDLLQ